LGVAGGRDAGTIGTGAVPLQSAICFAEMMRQQKLSLSDSATLKLGQGQ